MAENEEMSLDIFDHPTVERLIQGERIRVQELREALVEFWEKNGTFAICANCPAAGFASVTGCCGACKWHDLEKGCTKRNVSCLTFTCPTLTDRLMKLGLWERYDAFRQMLWGDIAGQEEYYNQSRLPDDAELFIVEHESYYPGEVEIATNAQGNLAPTQIHLDPDQFLEKLSRTNSVVSPRIYHDIKQKFPDFQVRLREERYINYGRRY